MSAADLTVPGSAEPADPALDVRGVSFAYGDAPVLDDVSFTVGAGEFVALVGPNGAGKSTLLRIVLGLLTPSTGSVRLFGQPFDALGDRWRIGYVPQRPATVDSLPATVEEVVAAGRITRRPWWRHPRAADVAAVDHALEAVDLTAQRRQRFSELSGGQQQRALIAKALVSEPDLLVLDEPVAGVDATSQQRFRDTLVAAATVGTAVLLVSHELGAVAHDLDRVVVLAHTRISFSGPPDDLEAGGVSLGVHHHDLPRWLEDHA